VQLGPLLHSCARASLADGAGTACSSALLDPASCWQEKPEPALSTQGIKGE